MNTIRYATGASLVAALVVTAAPAAASDTSYGYFRTVEGSATQIQESTGERVPVEVHQPILVGDRVYVARSSRVEVVLPDRNRLRLDGRTEVTFDRLAYSADADDTQTVLRLLQGNLQITVVEEALGDALPRIDTPNSTVHVLETGRYRVTADGSDWSQAVVRGGLAEVVTRRGAALLNAGEEALIEGERLPRTVVRAATVEDSLERWAAQLERLAAAAEVRHVDRSLEYEAAPLARYGSWVQVDRGWAWRPSVSVTWQPYWRGRWIYTPSGLTWVSYEPWGRVTYHYGYWDYAPAYGWVWFPGRVYAPAWVYWYWGPSYVGWCPVGYYSRFYRPHFAHAGFGFRFGVHGWVGGSWGHFQRWTFVPAGRVGDRNIPAHARRGGDMRERLVRDHLNRGVLTTDTRAVKPHLWARPQDAVETLARQPVARGEVRSPQELPDVTDFVARRPRLAEPVARRVTSPLGEGRVSAEAPLPPTRARVAERPAGVGERPGGALPGREAVGRAPRPERVTPERAVPAARAGDGWRQGLRRPSSGEAAPADPRAPRQPAVTTRPGRVVEPEAGAADRRRVGGSTPRGTADPHWREPRLERPATSPTPRGRVLPGAPASGLERTPRRDAAPGAGSSPSERPVVRRIIDGARSSGSVTSPRRVAPQGRGVRESRPPSTTAPRSSPRREVASPPGERRSGAAARPSGSRRPPSSQSAPQRSPSRANPSRGDRSSRDGSPPRRRASSGSDPNG